MKLKIKDMDIQTGGPFVAIVNLVDAKSLDLHSGDRILIKSGRRSTTAIVNVAESEGAVPNGFLGVYEELIDKLRLKSGMDVEIVLENKPEAVSLIRKKLYGFRLSDEDMKTIVKDIVANKMTTIELSYFIAAGYTRGLDLKETVSLTKAMIDTGDTLHIDNKMILDKHCIGGVAGNRTTPVMVPILAAAGFTVPKTSSRSITSPAGTADTVEVMANVSLSKRKIESVVSKTGACLAWGGAVNLAPADDLFIKVEKPMSIDSEGQLLASVMAKKGSVGATHVLIDIPVGVGAKVSDLKRANHLGSMFKKVGSALKMNVQPIITDGNQPIGNGLGPAMEARDILFVLNNDPLAPDDLRDKSIRLSAEAMKMTGKVRDPIKKATRLLESGRAFDKLMDILKAQGARITDPEKITFAKHHFDVKADCSGKIVKLANKHISRTARVAGAPQDQKAGVFMHKVLGQHVEKGDVVFTIYAESEGKLEFARQYFKKFDGMRIK